MSRAGGWSVFPALRGWKWSAYCGANTRHGTAPDKYMAETMARSALEELKANDEHRRRTSAT